MRISYFAAACCAVTLFGCSSHPLIEDYSRKNTSSIVKKIRCEVRDALRQIDIESPSHRECKVHADNLREYKACVNRVNHLNCDHVRGGIRSCEKLKGDEKVSCDSARSRAVAEYKKCVIATPSEYEAKICGIREGDSVAERIAKYRNCQLSNYLIGFDFKLDITEKNNAAGGKLDFINPYIGGKFSLALSGGAEKTRKSERFFRTIESFDSIAKRKGCGTTEEAEDLIYPIAGKVGLDEVVVTFLELDNSVELRALEKKASGSSAESKSEDAGGGRRSAANPEEASASAPKEFPSIFSDTLTFTTKLSAGIKPTLELNSGAGNFKLRNASIDGTSERLDVHQVAVAMSKRAPDVSVVEFSAEIVGIAAIAATASNFSGGAFSRPRPTVITSPDATPIILELDRLRNKNDDETILESFRTSE